MHYSNISCMQLHWTFISFDFNTSRLHEQSISPFVLFPDTVERLLRYWHFSNALIRRTVERVQ